MGDGVREWHAHDFRGHGLVLHCGHEGTLNEGHVVDAAHFLGVGLRVELCSARDTARRSAMVLVVPNPAPDAPYLPWGWWVGCHKMTTSQL